MIRTDYEWLAKLMAAREASTPNSVEDAIVGLTKLGIDVNLLRNVLKKKREEWQNNWSLATHGIQAEFMDPMLLIHSYSLQEPSVFSTVSNLLNNTTQRVEPSGKIESGAIPCVSGVDMGLTALPTSFDVDGIAWRGKKFTYPDLEKMFPAGREVYWYTSKSVSDDAQVMQNDFFCGSSGPRTILGNAALFVSSYRDKALRCLRHVADDHTVGLAGDWLSAIPVGAGVTRALASLQEVDAYCGRVLPHCRIGPALDGKYSGASTKKSSNNSPRLMHLQRRRLVGKPSKQRLS